MQHVITAKNTTVSDPIRNHIETKFNHAFGKYLTEDAVVRTKIEVIKSCRHKVEVTISLGKQTLRAEVSETDGNSDMYNSIDKAASVMTQLLIKRKKKLEDKKKNTETIRVEHTEEENDNNECVVARTKHHEASVMSVKDACEAMEMLGHSFFVFRNAETMDFCVVYKRYSGDYGLLIY